MVKLADIIMSGSMVKQRGSRRSSKVPQSDHQVFSSAAEMRHYDHTRRWYLKADAVRQIDRLRAIVGPNNASPIVAPIQLRAAIDDFLNTEAATFDALQHVADEIERWHDGRQSSRRSKRTENQDAFCARAAAMIDPLPECLVRLSKAYKTFNTKSVSLTDNLWHDLEQELLGERPKLLLKFGTRDLFEAHVKEAHRAHILREYPHLDLWPDLYPEDYQLTHLLYDFGFMIVQPLGGLRAARELCVRLRSSQRLEYFYLGDLPDAVELACADESFWTYTLSIWLSHVWGECCACIHSLMTPECAHVYTFVSPDWLAQQQVRLADLIAETLYLSDWSCLTRDWSMVGTLPHDF